MVKRLGLFDEENYIVITPVTLLDLPVLRDVVPRCPRPIRSTTLEGNADEETAWLLTALCRRRSLGLPPLYGRTRRLMEAPFHTYVFRDPHQPASLLAPLFEGRSGETNYRVVLHRSPRHANGREIWGAWNKVYLVPPAVTVPRKEHLNRKEREAAVRFLNLSLTCYKEGIKGMMHFCETTEQPYSFSEGVLDGPYLN